MIFVNFGHPLNEAQLLAIDKASGQRVDRVVEVPVQFADDQEFGEQARALVDSAQLSARDWQTATLLVNLPSLNTIAALVLAEIHGRAGYFPSILRMRPVPGAVRQFEFAEIVNLQVQRDNSRQTRGG